jgi:hypothetical protein
VKHTAHYQWRRHRDRRKEVGPDFLVKSLDANIPHDLRCAIIEGLMKKRFLKHEGYKDRLPFKS